MVNELDIQVKPFANKMVLFLSARGYTVNAVFQETVTAIGQRALVKLLKCYKIGRNYAETRN